MDNKYNVDDILSEIKSRKLRERAAAESGGPGQERPDPPRRREEAGPPRDTPPDGIPSRSGEPFSFRIPGGEPDARAEEGPSDGGFNFVIPPAAAEKKSNPLDFGGHVRSISDKAKMRQARFGGNPPPLQPPDDTLRFRPSKPDPGATQVLDFSALSSPPAADGTQDQRTRVLPKIGFSRELDLGDVRRGFDDAAGDLPYDGEYEDYGEDGLPESTPIDFSEYNSVDDRRDVATDIARVKLWLFIRSAVTLLLTGALFYLTFAGHYVLPLPGVILPENDWHLYLLTATALTGLVALVNSSSMGGGLISLLKMRSNSDTLSVLAILGAIGQGVVFTVRHEQLDYSASLGMYCCVASLAVLFGTFGKLSMISRIQQNFRVIASDKPKKAVLAVESDEFCREFVREPSRRRPTVAYSVRAGFLTEFLALSYSDKYDVGINRAVAPVCLLGALCVGGATYMLSKDVIVAVSALSAILCVCATFSATFIENVPLGKLAKKLAPQGAMVSGNKAVEDFCDTAAVLLTENELFPRGTVSLLGIKSYSQGRVDEAILDAASVICSMECALSEVFLQMIGGNRGLLKKVDNIVYENGMGISAWVDSRRVLIGNRLLMQNHGIPVPDGNYEQKFAQQGGEPLFVSNSGEMSAQFVIGYTMDSELAVQLDQLAAHEKPIILRTVNPHLTPRKIWDLYGYPQQLVQVLPAERHPLYDSMAAPRETAIAEIAYTGKTSAFIAALIACMNARSSILSATVLQMAQIILGYALTAFMAFMGAIGSLTVVEMAVYQLFWFFVIFVLQKLKTP